MDKTNKVELSETDKAKEFLKEYESLCQKHGFQININPAFKSRDDGTWSVVLQASVGKTPKQE